MKVLLISLFAVSVAWAEEDGCLAEVEGVKECIKTIFDEAQANKEERMNDIFAKKTQCFRDNGCADPRWEEYRAEWKAERKAKCDCVTDVFQNDIKADLGTCIRRDIPEFEFPADFWEMMKMKKKLKRDRGKKFMKMVYKMNDLCDNREEMLDGCPTPEAREEAAKCMKNVHEKNFWKKGGRNKENKGAMKKCWTENISEACKEKMKTVKGAMCDCAVNILDNNVIKEKIHDCYNDNNGDEDEEPFDADQSEWIVKKMTKYFCCKKRGDGPKA